MFPLFQVLAQGLLLWLLLGTLTQGLFWINDPEWYEELLQDRDPVLRMVPPPLLFFMINLIMVLCWPLTFWLLLQKSGLFLERLLGMGLMLLGMRFTYWGRTIQNWGEEIRMRRFTPNEREEIRKSINEAVVQKILEDFDSKQTAQTSPDRAPVEP